MSRQDVGFYLLALVFAAPCIVGLWLRWLSGGEHFKKGGP